VNTDINKLEPKSEENTETVVVLNSNLAIDAVLNDKLDYTSVRLLSDNQNKLIQLQKGNNEKQR
jgi:hypothetical protein